MEKSHAANNGFGSIPQSLVGRFGSSGYLEQEGGMKIYWITQLSTTKPARRKSLAAECNEDDPWGTGELRRTNSSGS